MNVKKIILFTGGVETLSYFAMQMGNAFIRYGISVFYYDLKNQKESTKKIRKFIKAGETALITFNFQGLSKENGVYSDKSGYIWQEYNLPCYNIAVDHPYYYDRQLSDLPRKYVHISIDRLHEKYFKEYYPEFKNGGFLPLAGTNLYPDKYMNKMSERSIDVLFPGNYTPPSFCEPYINGINEEYAQFYRRIIDDLLENPNRTLEEAAIEETEKELGRVAYNDMRKVLNKMIFIDLYVRNYMRGKVVRVLAENGIKVNVIGKDWEKLECKNKENIIITQFSDSKTCMEAMRNAKIVVNVMPWFKDGAHDRVFNAILNGAVSISDKSRFLMEELPEGCGVSYYDLNEIERLPDIINIFLKDERKLEEITECGYKKVSECDTWENRAKMLMDIIKSD